MLLTQFSFCIQALLRRHRFAHTRNLPFTMTVFLSCVCGPIQLTTPSCTWWSIIIRPSQTAAKTCAYPSRLSVCVQTIEYTKSEFRSLGIFSICEISLPIGVWNPFRYPEFFRPIGYIHSYLDFMVASSIDENSGFFWLCDNLIHNYLVQIWNRKNNVNTTNCWFSRDKTNGQKQRNAFIS